MKELAGNGVVRQQTPVLSATLGHSGRRCTVCHVSATLYAGPKKPKYPSEPCDTREDSLKTLLGISRAIDRFNTKLGMVLAWAILLAVLVSTVNAIVRKTLNTSSNA